VTLSLPPSHTYTSVVARVIHTHTHTHTHTHPHPHPHPHTMLNKLSVRQYVHLSLSYARIRTIVVARVRAAY
jgi:hypothetical protein